MITEDFVSFEIAKLLKEKGFDINTLMVYSQNGNFMPNGAIEDTYQVFYAAPTLQMTMKWLREIYNIIPVILTGGDTVTTFYYWFRIDKINDGKWEDSVYRNETECNTYEEACEAAITYCLENLI